MKSHISRDTEDSSAKWLQSTDKQWNLKSVEDTIHLGQALKQIIPNCKLLLLKGPLGAGKTSLVKGIASSLGIQEIITSPTFALAQHYCYQDEYLVHLDLYRLESPESADEFFLEEEEYAKSLKALMVVEWPERLGLKLSNAWNLELQYQEMEGRLAILTPPQDSDRKVITSS